jgi:hypothetical protein
MKKIQIIPLVALLCICFCFAQCHKDKSPVPDNPYGLPNATQRGAGVFACRINGVNHIAPNKTGNQGGGAGNGTVGVFGSFPVTHFYDYLNLGLRGSIKINVKYDLADTLHTFCYFQTDSTCSMIGSVTNIKPSSGNLTLTKLDTINKVISGIFYLRIPIPNCDTFNVTDGRFDISY